MTRIYQPRQLPDGSDNPRYKKRARPSGTPRVSRFHRGEFIAWDGEGVTDAKTKRHRYVMMLNSARQETIIDTRGIPTRDCLDALCTVGEANPKAIHVVFGGSYDVNMILGDCTYDQIASVWSGAWTKVCGGMYSVNYRARKSFSIRRMFQKSEQQGSSIVLWDVFGFFQSSFVEAGVKYLGESDTLAKIKERKAQRSTFRVRDLEAIEEYCAMECDYLVSLMERLREYLALADLPISRWDGAGACAASLMRREKVVEHKRARKDSEPEVLRAAQFAYAGGRTEMIRYGHAPNTKIFHYDINSAYPHQMRSCPSFATGHWVHGFANKIPASSFALCRVEWNFKDAPMYPFFWRSYDTSIYYPQRGRGWVWRPEVDAAKDAIHAGVLRGNFRILETWEWRASRKSSPFAFIDPIFEQRAQWKRDGIGAEKVLKLAVNSLYGKTAQHVGGTKNEPPRYHQLEWAGYITSATRAMVYRACALSFKRAGQYRMPRIVMVATDGVYSLDKLDLDTGDALGQWEETPHDGITVVQSGVYWTDNTRRFKTEHELLAFAEKEQKKESGRLQIVRRGLTLHIEKFFCRGFDKGSLKRRGILHSWRAFSRTYKASLTRFVTMGSGLVTRDAFQTRWRQWRKCPRTLKLSPDGTKRFTLTAWTRAKNPASSLIMTAAALPAAQVAGQYDSAPYPLPWDDGVSLQRHGETLDGASARIVETEAYDATI